MMNATDSSARSTLPRERPHEPRFVLYESVRELAVEMGVEVEKRDALLAVHVDDAAVGGVGNRVIAADGERDGSGLGHFPGNPADFFEGA